MTLTQLREIEAKATKVFETPTVLRERTPSGDGNAGDCRVWHADRKGMCVAVFHDEPTGRHYIAMRSHLPALLAVAEAAQQAVDAGAVEEIHLSMLRGALADLEAVK